MSDTKKNRANRRKLLEVKNSSSTTFEAMECVLKDLNKIARKLKDTLSKNEQINSEVKTNLSSLEQIKKVKIKIDAFDRVPVNKALKDVNRIFENIVEEMNSKILEFENLTQKKRLRLKKLLISIPKFIDIFSIVVC